jgi:anti-sigma B factor antagonist
VGRIDHATADGFRPALTPHVAGCAAGDDRLVLDLSGVEYISSVGLRVLMLASKQAKAQRGSLAVCGLVPVVREIFEISRFNLVLDVSLTLREALARLSEPALAAPDAAAGVEDRLVGGLGVLLVSAMAQDVEYRRVGDKNRISLVIGG